MGTVYEVVPRRIFLVHPKLQRFKSAQIKDNAFGSRKGRAIETKLSLVQDPLAARTYIFSVNTFLLDLL
jgi:hypothetical protein